jgi:hypothetical protein
MAHDAEMMASPPSAQPAAPSAAAERMRRHRERRREGLRCLTVEVRESEIDTLVRMGLLTTDMRNNTIRIIEALHAHFDRTLI